MKTRTFTKLLATLFILTQFATPVSASTPLRHARLAHGKSKALDNPDYFFKLYESVMLNSDYSKIEQSTLRNFLSYVRTPGHTSEDFYNLDTEVRRLMTPLFERYFPKQLTEYNIIFLNDDEKNAGIYTGEKGRRKPTIFISLELLKLFKYEEQLQAVLLHEAAHHLRSVVENDAWYNRTVNAMAEESLADAFAVRVLAESGKNPLAVSQLVEILLNLSKTDRGFSPKYVGFSSHPPSKVRLTAVNTLIEKYADRMHFPELTPLSTTINHYISSAPDQQTPAGFNINFIYNETKYKSDLAGVYYNFYNNAGPRYKQVGHGQIQAELAVLRSRVVPGNLSTWGASGSWEEIAHAFHKTWDEMKLTVRTSPATVQLMQEEEGYLLQLAANNGRSLETIDSVHIEAIKAHTLVTSIEDFTVWKNKYSKIKASDFLRQTYSLNHNDSLFINAFNHYIDLAPQFSAWVNTAYAKNDTAQLRALVLYRDTIMAHLLAWLDVISTRLETQKDSELTRGFQNEYERSLAVSDMVKDEIKKVLTPWNQKIEQLPLSDVMKLALFPQFTHNSCSNVMERFSVKYIHEVPGVFPHINDGIFLASQGFLKHTLNETPHFSDFNKGLRLLLMFQHYPGKSLDFSIPHAGNINFSHDFPLKIKGAQQWLLDTLAKLKITTPEALALLENDNYWENPPQTNESIRTSVTSHMEFAFRISDIFRPHGKVNSKKYVENKNGIRREVNESLDWLLDKNNFYSRPEYTLNAKYAQEVQSIIYRNLKEQNTLPDNLSDEVHLWTRFTKRGVSAFTDEWAASLINRTSSNPELLRKIYESNLVWDLPLRQQMAIILFRPENHPTVARLREDAANPPRTLTSRVLRRGASILGLYSRSNDINALLRDVTREFPEDSQERIAVVDNIAQYIQASPTETTYMMGLAGLEQRSLSDLSLTKKLGFGVRLYAQVFGELNFFTINERLQFLDFLLGHTDTIPWVISFRRLKREDEQEREASYNHRPYNKKPTPILDTFAQNEDHQYGPFRIRRSFQALSTEAKAALLDPLFVGQSGIMESKEGRLWVINSLVPADASWRGMATDLTEGFVEALSQFGQSHLKTLFISYLIASNYKNGRTQYEGLFPYITDSSTHVDTREGRLLRSLFSANAPLTKIGQSVHSSQVLPRDVNESLASLKENASHVLRDDQFQWLESAEIQNGASSAVHLQDTLGNASVKLVANALINGAESILFLIKPNAFHRGDAFFQMIDYAVNYALERGHDDLRLIKPLIARARTTFQAETDLNLERASAERMSTVYTPEQSYGDGYRFISIEFLSITDKIFKTNLVAAARRVRTLSFSELSQEDQAAFARAVTEKEAEIHTRSEGTIHYDRDRHEGNYLLIDDEVYLRSIGLEGQNVILVIDMGQATTINASTRNAILDGVAAITAHNLNMINTERAVEQLESILRDHLLEQRRAPRETTEEHLAKVKGLQGGAALSRLLAYIEGDGFTVRDDVFDYLAALNTFSTWERYQPNNPFIAGLRMDVLNRCAQLLTAATSDHK